MYLPCLRQAAIASDSNALTASSRSSNDFRDDRGVAVDAERELRHVVGADGHAVEVLQITVGEQGVGRQLAHHDHAQAVDAAP